MIEKKFLLFPPHEREETKKLSICSELRNGKGGQYGILDRKLCENCRVFLMSDRFLGQHFSQVTGIPRNKYPYVVLVNAAGCNLDCWYCYAHKMLGSNQYQKLNPKFLSSKNLAKCFACKIGYASTYLDYQNRHPLFSRVRITGGEPLASSKDTLKGFKSDLYTGTVEFWKDFFIEFNRAIGELISEDRICLRDATEIKPLLKQEKFEKPVWITSKKGRITIRFDTNGLLFCNRKNAEDFLDSIYLLNKDKTGSYLYVEIDYSLKGATPREFGLSQRKELDKFKESEKFIIEDHPQFKGIKNIIEISNEKILEDPDLQNSLNLTVERGIENHERRCYLYHENSLPWNEFQEKVNEQIGVIKPFHLSEVKNPIQWTKMFGMKPYLQRYLNRGCKIILKCDDQVVECTPENPKYLDTLIGTKKRCEAEGKECKIILQPVLSSQSSLKKFLA